MTSCAFPKLLHSFSVCAMIQSADLAPDDARERFQLESMRQLYCMDMNDRRAYSPVELRRIENGEMLSVCPWRGVLCRENTVWSISLSISEDRIRVDTRWFPSSVAGIRIINIPICSRLYTRSLPRALIECRIERCKLNGSLDLAGLPPQLRRLDLSANNFCGTLNVQYLPSTIQSIHLERNLIKKVVVMRMSLPEYLYDVVVGSRRHRTRFKCLDHTEVPRFFDSKPRSKHEFPCPSPPGMILPPPVWIEYVGDSSAELWDTYEDSGSDESYFAEYICGPCENCAFSTEPSVA